ncbi:MAG: hypothetical protein GEV08_02555 [Acidimicrobiia bacterium]|nr:hypothetical protein [Acidimicrobiia bacterium]
MLRKFLFVGLGGSGGKTLRFLRHELLGWLDTIGWTGGMPSAWQMIHIDTPTAQDGGEIEEVELLPPSNYLGLVMSGVDFRAVSDKVSGASPEEGWRDLAGWRVDPTYLRVPITTGAGQYRAVGRTIGLAYADRILDALRGAHARLSSASAGAELAEIHQLAYGKQAHTPTEPVVIVVSSLAGGTGAGLLLDACDLLRQLPGTAGRNTFGILYASDVFAQLGDAATAGVQPNALAALSELMNGYWLTGNYARASSLFAAAGASTPIDRSGPAFPFLVGASNTRGVTFGDQREVYAMMGRALRGWATDPTIQIKLVEYTMANWQSSAEGNAVKADIVVRDHQPVFEAFGYAEVGLGLDRFGRYSEERLARMAAEWLLDGHHRRALDIDPNDARDPREIAEALARDELVHFLRAARLYERNGSDQVIDNLQPEEAQQLLHATLGNIGEQVRSDKAMPAQAWTTRIAEVIPGNADALMQAYDERLRARARSWVDEAPRRVLEEVLAVVSRHGLETAAVLVRYVAEELADACRELGEEMTDHLRWSEGYRSEIAARLTQSGNVPFTNAAIEDAMRQGIWVGGNYRAEARRREVARALLDGLRTDFLTPLARSLEHARSHLHQLGMVGDGVREPLVRSWPDGPVPTRLRPPRNEFLVLDLDEFPGRFEDLLASSTRSKLAGESVIEARSSVIVGDFLSEDGSADLAPPVEIRTAWSPDTSWLLGGVQPRAAATFTTSFSAEDLLRRARAWLGRPAASFSRFLGSDLRSYLGDDQTVDPAETAQRRAAFRTALTSALGAAEPLVRLDTGLLSLLHHRPSIPQRPVPSTLPFKDHPMEEVVADILSHALGGGSAPGDLGAQFSTAQNVRSISISSTLGAAHDPLVFASIMDPIVRGWNAAKQSPPARTNFWTSRRARPVEEFVPASHEVILAMTRGWFTGLLLGRIDRERRCIAAGNKTCSFPQPLLREVGQHRDLLPAVLEALGLAYAEVAQLQSLEPLGAYVALRDLGLQPGLTTMQAAHVYERLNGALDRWVRIGDAGPKLSTPVVELRSGDLTSASATDRREAAIGVFTSTARDYANEIELHRKRSLDDAAVHGSERAVWPGMYSMIDRALSELVTALEHLELGDMSAVM